MAWAWNSVWTALVGEEDGQKAEPVVATEPKVIPPPSDERWAALQKETRERYESFSKAVSKSADDSIDFLSKSSDEALAAMERVAHVVEQRTRQGSTTISTAMGHAMLSSINLAPEVEAAHKRSASEQREIHISEALSGDAAPSDALEAAASSRAAQEVPEGEPYTGSMRKADPGSKELINKYTIPDASIFQVRGPRYLVDGVKQRSKPAVCHLAAVDLLTHKDKISNIASRGDLEAMKRIPGLLFIVSFQIPTDPQLHLVLYFQVPEEETPENRVALSLLKRFISRDEPNEFRDTRFKIIPTIADGPWIVKKAVGGKPAILPNKLTTTYYWGERYFEMDVDIGSSVAAGAIFGLVKNYLPSLVIDLAFVIEGKEDAELPEQVIGALRMNNLNMADHLAPLEDK